MLYSTYTNKAMFPNFWNDIVSMVKENYSHLYDDNDLLTIGNHNKQKVSSLKESFPTAKKLIAYQTEQLVPGHWWSVEHILSNIIEADEIWDYDLENIKVLKKYNINAKFRPILYTSCLQRIKNVEEPDIDILFYGSLTPRRNAFLEYFTWQSSYNYVVIINNDITAIDEYIARSKIVLNIHPHEHHRQEQTRISYLLHNNKCVISEKSNINYFSDLIVEAEPDKFLEVICDTLENDKWKSYTINTNENLKILDSIKREKVLQF